MSQVSRTDSTTRMTDEVESATQILKKTKKLLQETREMRRRSQELRREMQLMTENVAGVEKMMLQVQQDVAENNKQHQQQREHLEIDKYVGNILERLIRQGESIRVSLSPLCKQLVRNHKMSRPDAEASIWE